MPTVSPTHHRARWRAFLRRLRCLILPPKNGVFVDGRWQHAVPLRQGPAIATLDGKVIPEWWILACGRQADFVGIHDGRQLFFRQPPTRPGEIIINRAIYRVRGRAQTPPANDPSVTNPSSHAA